MQILSPAMLPGFQNSRRVAIHVKSKAIPAIRTGHPWLFEDSIKKSPQKGSPGDIAILYDSNGKKILAAGLYDPGSSIRVRILQNKPELPPIGSELFYTLVKNASDHRIGRISANTTAWRLINGESDGFPGLVADQYESTLVLKIYSESFIPWLGSITNALFSVYPSLKHCVLRLARSLKSSPFTQAYFPNETSVYSGTPCEFTNPILFRENNIFFEANVLLGQKTGFFLDQRENRIKAGQVASGRDVLNVFSFSGGFSLYAAQGGAKSVCSVDADKHAIAACVRHFELNKNTSSIGRCRHEEVTGDAFETMSRFALQNRKFGLVIVDPPSFAKSTAEYSQAIHSYKRLAGLADKLLQPGGILIFASCSSRVPSDDFFRAILSNVHVREIERTFHAPDHPAKFPESGYLKCLYGIKQS